MNLVRSVAGLLRRSSVAQDGDNSQNQQQEASVIPALLTHVEFSEDADEKVLNALWQGYEESSGKAEKEKALEVFLVYFLRVYENWMPADSGNADVSAALSSDRASIFPSSVEEGFTSSNPPKKESSTMVGCTIGHPTRVVVGLAQEMKSVIISLTQLRLKTDGIDASLPSSLMKGGTWLLHVLTIVTRSNHNRQVFRFCGGLQILMSFMKAAVVQYKGVAGVLTVEDTPSSAVRMLANYLQSLLENIITIVAHFICAGITDIQDANAEQPDFLLQMGTGNTQSTGSRRVTFERRGTGNNSVPLMETGGLNWFVELLRILGKLRISRILPESSLENLTLRTLRAALVANSRAQNHFRSIGGIDVLIDGLGNPLEKKKADVKEDEWYILGDFQMQVLSLEVLREAVFRNLTSLQYLFEKKGIQKFSGIIFQTAFISPGMNSQEAEDAMDGDNLQGWNSQVAQLCRILCSFLLPSGDICSFVTGFAGGNDVLGATGSYWELATRWIVKVLLGVFRNADFYTSDKENSQVPRLHSTTLQHYMLYVFKKMLAVLPAVLTLFREEGIWEVMFSKHFFYFEMDMKSSFSPTDCDRLLNSSSLVVETNYFGYNQQSIDSEPLRLEVISFVELAATGTIDHDNVPECSALMEALEQCTKFPSVVTMIVKSLHRILQLAADQTVGAFVQLKALVLLSQVMELQLQAYNKVVDLTAHLSKRELAEGYSKGEHKNQWQQLHDLQETWKQAREAVFDLFAEYLLTSEEARIVSLHSTKTLNVLFNLLWEKGARKFAIRHILDLMKLPPASEEDQEAKLELCIKYLETLSQSGVEGHPKEIDILMELLSGICEIVQTDSMYYQALFQEGECFVHIVSLLNENLSEQEGKLLSLSVVQTLMQLLAGNEASKAAFRSLVGTGYATLQTLLINSHQGSPTKELLSALLDMLVDGSFNIPAHMVIQNEDVIALYFNILHQCSEKLQSFGLLTFHRILEESTSNRAACVRAGLMSLLLDWFGMELNESLIAKLVALIEAVGRHSVSGKDMRKIFSLLRNVNASPNGRHRKALLSVVQGMLKEEGPAVFFELSGKDSGIMITTPVRWPSTKGFTLSCWLRVENFPAITDSNEDESLMGLSTFLTESRKGYIVLIGKDKVVLESTSHKRQSSILKVELQEKRWYFLSMTHSTGRTLSGGSIVRVYLDGSLAASDKLRYPKLQEPLVRSTLGASSPLPGFEGRATDSSGNVSFPFCGQLGPVYLFDDSLSADQISRIFLAGSGYMYSFLPTDIGFITENLPASNIFDLKDGVASKVIFGFNAKASSGRVLFDVASYSEGTQEKVCHEATIMAGTQLCYRRLVKDIIDCVGGVGVFFPILTQLDQPQSSIECLLRKASPEQMLRQSNIYVAAEVIDLITSVLDNSSAHQQYMCHYKGMAIMGFLLQSLPPKHLTTEVVLALMHMLSVVSKASDASLAKELVEKALVNIFLNLHIWIFTPYIIQRELLMALLSYTESQVVLVRNIISLPRILDIVQQFYWDRPRIRKAIGTKRLLHPVTKEVIGERPGREETGKLRILLLSLLETVLRDSISTPDVKVLLAYLERAEDPVCLEDVLRLLLGLLGRKTFCAVFIEHIQILGGCHLFLNLLKRQDESLRLLGLQIIGTLLISFPYEKKGSWLLTIAQGSNRASNDQQRVEREKLAPLIRAITERLLAFPFTDLLHATLFDVLLGGASPKQVLQRGMGTAQEHFASGQSTGSSLLTGRNSASLSQFVLPQILGIVFKFLQTCNDSSMRQNILRDILRLLEMNPSSSDALVFEPAWQAWLLDALLGLRMKKEQIDSEGETFVLLKEEEFLIRSIFAIIQCYCIYNVRGGWRHLERTLNFIHLYSEQGSLCKSDLLHDIFGDLLKAVLQARSQESVQMLQPCRDNSLYLLALMDELLIQETNHFLPFPSEDISEKTIHDKKSSADSGNLLSNFSSDKESSITIHCTTEPSNDLRGQHWEASQCETCEIKDEHWYIYDCVWILLREINGKGKGDTSTAASLGQRARGLVESINIPAAEMAAAVVAGGLGAVVSMNPSKLIDKAVKLRGDKFPRVAFHLVLLYIYRASLEAASRCVQQFVTLLPVFLTLENEQSKNRLQLFLWCLLEARAELGAMDNGARFHVISQLIRDTVEHGKLLLATSLVDKDNATNDSASVQSLLQQDRIINVVKEEKELLKSVLVERGNEVQALNAELKEAMDLETSLTKVLEDELQTTLGALCNSDFSRKMTLQLACDEDQQAMTKQWCHMFRHLTDERGPWSTLLFPNESQMYWKLDKTEDPWRRRLKLKRNYHFDEQLTYSKNSYESTGTLVQVSEKGVDALGETSNLLLKGLRGVSEEGVPQHIEEDNDSFEEQSKRGNLEETGLLSSESEEAFKELSANQQEQISNKADRVDEIIHSTASVLVTSKRKLAGRLEIMCDCLHFHCEFIVEGTGGSSVFSSYGLNSCCSEEAACEVMEKGGSKAHAGLFDGHNGGANVEMEGGNASEKIESLQHAASQGLLKDIKRHRRWDLSKVKAVNGTRYLLQHTALEIFFNNSLSPVFLNFPSQKHAKDVGSKIVSLRNKLNSGKGNFREKNDVVLFIDKRLAMELAERYRDCWRRREINNFEYLMHLNTLAGRSYNDLTQYPVFPWIISDYMSESLNLNSSSSFRDLSKPVGTLDAKRFEVFKERFRNFSDPDIPSFYYGSHYSTMGIVLFYLLRLEPFTSLHQNLQGGKFDHADRLFHSIEGAFANCLSNTSDVKELIPEFFYMPEFLVNSNRYHFGKKQDGESLDNVVLPQWAKGSPEDFISKNREALESEYASQHLHQWIDLIFGYKQRGRPAVEAANVFYHLTYEGAVELESLEDRLQRAAVEDQIANFGQTPMQLFRKKHPRRGPPMPISRPLYYAPASITLTSTVHASMLRQGPVSGDSGTGLLFTGITDGKVVLVTGGLRIIIRSWISPSQAGGNFTFSSSQDLFFGLGAEVSSSYRIRGPFAENVELSSSCFRTMQVRTSSYLLTCGHWDNSFRVISLSDGYLLQSNRWHKDVVCCLAVSSDGSIVVTGSHDTTVMVWEIEHATLASKKMGIKNAQSSTDRSAKGEIIFFDKPYHVLCGHDDAVISVAVSVELDLVVSGSKDSTCIFHTLRQGRYVQSVKHPLGSSISMLVLSKHGVMVVFSKDDLTFLSYSVNGKHLASSESNGRISCLEISNCGEFLVCGGDSGQVIVRSVYTLDVIRRYNGENTSILSLAVTSEDCFLAGTQDGNLLIYSIGMQQQRKSISLLSLRSRQS